MFISIVFNCAAAAGAAPAAAAPAAAAAPVILASDTGFPLRASMAASLAADNTAAIGSATTFLQVIGNPSIITIVPNGVGIEINGL